VFPIMDRFPAGQCRWSRALILINVVVFFFELALPQEIRSSTSGHSRLDYA
jgi:hypothetical protein